IGARISEVGSLEGVEAGFDRAARIAEDASVAAEPVARVRPHHQREELEAEHLGLRGAGDPRLARELTDPGIEGRGDRVADRTGTVIELGRGRAPEAPPG